MLKEKKIGELLQEAHLVNKQQLNVALTEKNFYPELKLGEILTFHGWLKQETADFFGNDIKIIKKGKNLLIGDIFFKAGLLSEQEIQDILHEQKQTGLRFGEIVTLKGLIKEETVIFFVENFASYKNKQDYYQYKKDERLNQSKKKNKFEVIYPAKQVQVIDVEDIHWIG